MRWRSTAADPLGDRQGPVIAWAGQQLLAVGGSTAAGAVLAGADAYNPKTAHWTMLPSWPLTARLYSASAWTSAGLLIWGGMPAPGGQPQVGHAVNDGAILDPARKAWHRLPGGPLPALTSAVAVTDSTGKVVILGGSRPSATSSSNPAQTDTVSRLVARYDPQNSRWQMLPPIPAIHGHNLIAVSAVRWSSDILVAATWSHVTHPGPGVTSGTGGVDLFRLDPDAGHWSRQPVPDSVPFVGANLQPIGNRLVVAGGTSCPPFAACPARLTTPFTVLNALGQPQLPTPTPPVSLRAATVVGDNYVMMAGSQITGPRRDEEPGDAVGYELAAHRWITLPSARQFKPDPESLTWTGRELLLWAATGPLILDRA